MNHSPLASGWFSAGLTGAEPWYGFIQEGIAAGSGVLEPTVGPIHFARKSTQLVPGPGPDRWSPLDGNRVSQRYLAAAGRH